MNQRSLFWAEVLLFLIAYSAYVLLVHIEVENYSDIIVATTFFFTLFSSFFITRQNDRYSGIADEVSNTDGLFSLLYRISSAAPGVQVKVREALRDHYKKIIETNNWAYHIQNPSNTITRIFNAYSEANEDESDKIGRFSDGYGGAFASVQVSRKRMIMLNSQRLLPLQWVLVYLLGGLMVISFNFIPAHNALLDIIKIAFGVAVLFVILLLRQLDNLSLFGKAFNERTAGDSLRVIEETDQKEIIT